MPNCDGISRDEWKCFRVEAKHEQWGVFANVYVSTTNPLTSVDGKCTLGNSNFEIVIHHIKNNPSLTDMTMS